MTSIRPGLPEDRATIREVVRQAFGGETKVLALLDALFESPTFIPELSLVAEERGEIVGHVLFSRIAIETPDGDVRALVLSPMSVAPGWQRRGIGSALIRSGLERARDLGHRIVVVEGVPAYYPRFGFVPAREQGLEPPYPVPDSAFMVLELEPGALQGVHGTVIFPPAFEAAR